MNKKVVALTITLLVILLFGVFFINTKKEYKTNLYYMDTYIYVKLYSKKDASEVLKKIDDIYKEYHSLTDRYNHYEGIVNIYDIYHNTLSDNELIIDSKLYDMLKYAKEWEEKYPKFSIEIGGTIDVWKKYRDSGEGIPTQEELDNTKEYTKLVLLEDNKILNNHPNLDLGAISKGYTTEIVGKYLESIGIDEYLINAGGNVKVGSNYKKKNYSIGIQSPIKGEDLMSVIKGNNISVVTSGGYERNYEYNGVTYHHIIDPDTLYPSNNMKSVTVVTKDSALGDILSTTLFLSSVEEGQEIIKDYDCEAIWYTNDNKIIKSEKFDKYE